MKQGIFHGMKSKLKGRPKLPDGQKKVKINIAIDPEVYAFLQTIGNRSRFINQAAKILIDAHRKVRDGDTTGSTV